MKPAIHATHGDAAVRELLRRDLEARFGADYELASHEGPDDALAALRRDAAEGRPVALVIGETVELLAAAHDLHPLARRVLLVGRGLWREEHPAVAALRSGRADSYVFVPWGPRERWLYLPVTEFLADWESSQKPEFEALRVVGEEGEPRTHELRDVLSRAGLPIGFYPAGSTEGSTLLRRTGLDGSVLPALVFRDGTGVADPSLERLATALGFATEPAPERFDVVIVGAGPAGLAAAVYAASEGLTTAVVEASVPGGQAGTSARIRNYLGFPNGVSGRDLASRALEQAWFFGARIVLSKPAVGIRADGDDRIVELAGGLELVARAVVVATGATWHRLGVPELEELQGAGVFYGAAASDATAPAGGSAFVVGAGNSAGQAAVHLARSAASVVLVARDERGYVLTGRDVTGPWPLERPPLLLETSLPGVFAAGDVRHGSVKRVASAVGAGGIAVQLVHLRLAEFDGAPPFIADRRAIPEPDALPPSEHA